MPYRVELLRQDCAVTSFFIVTRISTTPLPQPGKISGTGIDRLLADATLVKRLRTTRTGLLTHDACRTIDGIPTRRAVARAFGSSTEHGLVRLFTPEHGLAAAAPAGAAVGDGVDPQTGVPVVSLYGRRLQPDTDMLADLDTVLIDLRDVGVRCFTYAATAARLIDVAVEANIDIVVCDRPNPLGARSAGPSLDPALRSLVAWLDVPFVHGRTIGELLKLAADDAGLARIKIVSADDVLGSDVAEDWVPPSPALDHPHSLRLYPGLVLLEGTNLCEGRGTPVPFRSVSAPWLDTAALINDIGGWKTPLSASEGTLVPTTGRYAGKALPAVIFNFKDASDVDGLAFGINLLCSIVRRHPQFEWTRMPEGLNPDPGDDEERFVVDALLGCRTLRKALTEGDDAATILKRWQCG